MAQVCFEIAFVLVLPVTHRKNWVVTRNRLVTLERQHREQNAL